MNLYTIQLAKYRKLPDGVELIDTTFKSGNPIFAPSKEIVYGIKYQGMSEQEYTEHYYQQMRQSIQNNTDQWLALFKKESIAIACYCGSDKFCHRFLLKDILLKVAYKRNYPINYLGEIA